MVTLRFESPLGAGTREEVWRWITSVEGISAEMWPYFRMTVPRGVRSIGDVHPPGAAKLGARMFRSYVFLFGVLPVDYSDMTLVELDEGRGFVEESPMGSMRRWRHERRLAEGVGRVTLVDTLTFEPIFGERLVGWFIRKVFEHRHRVLRRRFPS